MEGRISNKVGCCDQTEGLVAVNPGNIWLSGNKPPARQVIYNDFAIIINYENGNGHYTDIFSIILYWTCCV